MPPTHHFAPTAEDKNSHLEFLAGLERDPHVMEVLKRLSRTTAIDLCRRTPAGIGTITIESNSILPEAGQQYFRVQYHQLRELGGRPSRVVY